MQLRRAPLPYDLDAPAVARLQVRSFCAAWPEDVLDDVLLVTTELVPNAVRHGGPPVTSTVRVTGPRVRVEVADGGAGCRPGLRPLAAAGSGHQRTGTTPEEPFQAISNDTDEPWGGRTDRLQDEGGRGLLVLEAIATRWGVSPERTGDGPGTTVWFEVGHQTG